jgi:hypothetical protein
LIGFLFCYFRMTDVVVRTVVVVGVCDLLNKIVFLNVWRGDEEDNQKLRYLMMQSIDVHFHFLVSSCIGPRL